MLAHATGDVQIKQFERGLLGRGGEGGLIASFLRGGSAMTILSLLLLWSCQKASESLTSSVQSQAMGDTDSLVAQLKQQKCSKCCHGWTMILAGCCEPSIPSFHISTASVSLFAGDQYLQSTRISLYQVAQHCDCLRQPSWVMKTRITVDFVLAA